MRPAGAAPGAGVVPQELEGRERETGTGDNQAPGRAQITQHLIG